MAKASTTTPGKLKAAARATAKKPQATAAAAKQKAAKAVAVTAAAPKMASTASKASAKPAPAAGPAAGKLKRPAAKATATTAKSAPAKANRPAAKAKTPAGAKPPPNKLALKPAAKRAAAPRPALPAKTGGKTTVKTATARRSANRTTVPAPPSRRTRSIAAPRKVRTPPRELPATARKDRAASADTSFGNHNAPHNFTVSHLHQEDFKPDGLRAYARYRDLGIAAATGGLCQAHVIRFNPPCTDEVRQPHAHDVELQLVYVLQGWMKNDFDGHGTQMMSTGSCWLQPRGIRHTVLDYSPDCEVLEVIVPADFKTRQV